MEILCEPEPDPVPHSRLNRKRKTEEVSQSGESPNAPLVVRTSQSGIIPDTQNMIGLSDLIPDNKEIEPTFQVRN